MGNACGTQVQANYKVRVVVRSYWEPLSYVSAVQPAVSVQGLGGPLWVPQVPPEHTGASHADLHADGGRSAHRTPLQMKQREGSAHLSFPVLGVVIHLRNVDQLHHGAGQGGADVA